MLDLANTAMPLAPRGLSSNYGIRKLPLFQYHAVCVPRLALTLPIVHWARYHNIAFLVLLSRSPLIIPPPRKLLPYDTPASKDPAPQDQGCQKQHRSGVRVKRAPQRDQLPYQPIRSILRACRTQDLWLPRTEDDWPPGSRKLLTRRTSSYFICEHSGFAFADLRQ
jgi:hypothetical protein